MKIPLLDGRDFRAADTSPGVAIVNEAFAKTFFNGENPIGKTFERVRGRFYQIVGLVRDVPYRNVREPIFPVAYVPFQSIDANRALQPIAYGAFIVRSSTSNPLALASSLRQELRRARSDFRVSNIGTQEELNRSQTIREHLLAMLALFFAAVALLLAGIGLFGVLDYGVLQRRREIGIRIAIGAQPGHIAWRVTVDVLSMVVVGALAGLAVAIASVRSIDSLLYQVKSTDLLMLAIPSLMIFVATLLAALPAVFRAVRIDPAKMLRAD